jgi:hypothetical protein
MEKPTEKKKEIYPDIVEKENEKLIFWNEKEDERLKQEENLWTWNLVCGILHLLQAMALLLLGINSQQSSNFKLPLTTSFVVWNNGIPNQQLKILGYLKFAPFASVFSWITAIAHFIVLLRYKSYIQNLRQGKNTIRWYEYSLSASIMQALIAMLFGMYDIIMLILLLTVNFLSILFAHMMEIHNAKLKITDWTPFVFGGIGGTILWVVTFTFLASIENISIVPNYIWAVCVSYFVMFLTFPLNLLLQYRRVGLWADANHGYRMGGYYFGEKMFQVLSVLSKSIMIWIVFGGSLEINPYSQSSS